MSTNEHVDYICARLKNAPEKIYHRLATTSDLVFPLFSPDEVKTDTFGLETPLDDNGYYCVENASDAEFAIDLMKEKYESMDFHTFQINDFSNIDYLFVQRGNQLFFQNMTKAKLVTKKGLFQNGENFVYRSDWKMLAISDQPDAIYDRDEDKLYFQRLDSITSLFPGINALYVSATKAETEQFWEKGKQIKLISQKSKLNVEKIKTANRSRIKKVLDLLNDFDRTDQAKKNKLDNYMKGYNAAYIQSIQDTDGSYIISSENDLKELLYVLDERFYTTEIHGEKRRATSVKPL